jgi:hypothetical protein
MDSFPHQQLGAKASPHDEACIAMVIQRLLGTAHLARAV